MDCPTGKRRFRGEQEAKRAQRCNPKRVRVYLCPMCHGWHVSQENNTRRRGEE